MPRSRHERKTIVVKVLIARETKLPGLPGLSGDCDVLRQVDIHLTGEEAKKEDLISFGKRVEKSLSENPRHVEKPSGFSIKTIHVNEAKKIMAVVFEDGTKQIVKCSPEDSFDAEIGFALALSRKLFGSKTQVLKYIDRNAKVIKSPVIDKPKRGRKPRKVVEQSQKEEN